MFLSFCEVPRRQRRLRADTVAIIGIINIIKKIIENKRIFSSKLDVMSKIISKYISVE